MEELEPQQDEQRAEVLDDERDADLQAADREEVRRVHERQPAVTLRNTRDRVPRAHALTYIFGDAPVADDQIALAIEPRR